MKKINVKLSITLTVLAVVMFIASAMFMFVPKVNSAYANTLEPFSMEQAASVRLSNNTGIRFKAVFNQDIKNRIDAEGAELGFIVASNDSFKNYAGVDYINMTNKLTKVADKNKIYAAEQSGYYKSNIVLADVDSAYHDSEFSALAYLKEGESYTYATFDKAFSRSVNYVVEQQILTDPTSLDTVRTYYANAGTTSQPVRLNTADDYAKITDVEKDFTDINLKVASDIALADGYAKIPTDFAGSFVQSNNSISVTSADGSPKYITEDGTTIDNLGFKVVAGAVMKIGDTSADRFVNLIDNKNIKVDEPVVSIIDSSDASYPTNFDNAPETYSGKAIKYTINNGGSGKFTISYNGTAPEDAKYVSFWFAISGFTVFYNLEAGEIFHSGDNAKILNNTYDSFNWASYGKNVYKTTSGSQTYGKWMLYYAPIDIFESYMISDGATNGGITLSQYTQDGTTGQTLFIGDISFVSDKIAPHFLNDLIDSDVSVYSNSPVKRTASSNNTDLEFVDINALKTADQILSNQALVDATHTLNGYTGKAFKAATYHSGWVCNADIDVSAFSLAQLSALADTYTHLEVNFAIEASAGFQVLVSHYVANASTAPENIKGITGLVLSTDFGAQEGKNYSYAATSNKTWYKFNVPIQRFIDCATAAILFESTQTNATLKNQEEAAHKNKVKLFTAQAGSAVTVDVYYGAMTFINIPTA